MALPAMFVTENLSLSIRLKYSVILLSHDTVLHMTDRQTSKHKVLNAAFATDMYSLTEDKEHAGASKHILSQQKIIGKRLSMFSVSKQASK